MHTTAQLGMPRRPRRAGRVTAAASIALLVGLAGCGGGPRAHAAPAPAARAGDVVGFDEVIAALQQARIALCRPAEGGDFVSLPAPEAETAAAAAYFGYLEGRIYQFGPCDAPAARRNELRLFRYPDAGLRDAAIRQMATRESRPTAAFAVGDSIDAQIWSPNPSLETATGRAAATVHSAIAYIDHARHLDVGP